MAEAERRNPDELLAELQREEARARRGRLRIFFGASAGVGKTYAMLEAARAMRASGADIVIGYVERHGRAATDRLLEGLEQLPGLTVRYRGIERREFDLDGALARRAAITAVDELAHSNLLEGEPPPRHAKRWQDVVELLEAGLDVWTTVNVQHLESLRDVVAGITGIRQSETVPDHVFDEADEIELIDLPPEDLLERLSSGKIYLPEQAGAATERFFRKPNLIALRELALRRTADRVDAAARAYSTREPASRPWLARDRFLVGVGPGDQGEELVRFAKRFADALDAVWTVVSVETPAMLRLSAAERDRRIAVLRLAESLGAETVTLDGPQVASTLIAYARTRNASRIVIGEPRRHGFAELWRRSTAHELIRHAQGIDVSVIAPRSPKPAAAPRGPAPLAPSPLRWDRYAWGLGTTALCTGAAALMAPYFALTNVVMVYLLGATFAGLRLGRGPAILTSILNVAAFDFFFVPPRFSFAITDFEYAVTFVVMLGVALTIANLMASVRQQTRVAGARERRTALLYAMSRELAGTRGLEKMARVSIRHVAETFRSEVAVLLPDAAGQLHASNTEGPPGVLFSDPDLSVGQWVFDHSRPAGLGTDALPAAPALYLPLIGSQRALGVLAVRPSNTRRILLPEQRHLVETFAGQIALAVERATLAERAESARVAAETEGVRNTLLASISHDLRTPLSVIAAASSALIDPRLHLSEATRAELAASIDAKARDMSELISNVLDLMRFESGRLLLRQRGEMLDDLVGSALGRVGARLTGHRIEVRLPADLPAVHVDATLVTQLLANLLENAARHTPPGTRVTIGATVDGGSVRVTVEDDGPGLPGPDPERLFVKFQRGRDESNVAGAGLGLAICRAIVEAHGGHIAAQNGANGGARFAFTLPVEADPS
jgi:two-component system sensor histidine kinase KdpD